MNDFSLWKFHLPNLRRRWWQVWKPRLIVAEIVVWTPEANVNAIAGSIYYQIPVGADSPIMLAYRKAPTGQWERVPAIDLDVGASRISG